ncbi:5'-nucleotidase C-terminal domain-containing protein [Ancylomarina sp. DW003]|nr:5'-nucleotidase [Ancylomarina sp. DW003]MDE5421401.1 5'-nucleotidase C-terminal domain-containing protein [Ancylomarina sp. DW003]
MQKHLNRLLWAICFIAAIACSSKPQHQVGAFDSNSVINSTLDQESLKDTAFTNLINHYKVGLDSQMNQIVSATTEPMISGKPESLLSNYIADAMLAVGNQYCLDNKLGHRVDLSIINNGGLRTSLPKGKITTGKLFELLPFENKLVIVGMKGSDLENVLKYIAVKDGEGVAGIKMGIDGDEAVDVKIGGKKLDQNKLYHIISIDYLVNGGDGMNSFDKRENFRHMHMKLREAIIDRAKVLYQSGIGIKSELDGRIYYEQ